MTKAELVSDVARKTGFTKKEVGRVISTTMEVLREAFERKEKVELRGFGVFEVKRRKARMGRNPRTKDAVKIPARWVLVFKPSKIIKEIL